MPVRVKKHLGQHFLNDPNIARKIVNSLTGYGNYSKIIEVGPGTGVLTSILLEKKELEIWLVEIDYESVDYLKLKFPLLERRVIYGDFLKFNIPFVINDKVAVIGNFPYNISSQILMRIVEFRDFIPEVVGMLQKEVAERIASPPGNKNYGILSVLLQAWYDTELLFDVPPHVFIPPPNVTSTVFRMKRNQIRQLDCNYETFQRIVHAGFNQRRKTLRNSLKSLYFPKDALTHELFKKRAEELSVQDFVTLTRLYHKM